jgi:hypothetical protein
MNEITKKNKSLLKKDSAQVHKDIRAITSRFKVHTILFHKQSLYFVLDYLNDKDAIINQFPGIKHFNPVFLTRDAFKDEVLENRSIIDDHIILYSCEKYYEIIEGIHDNLYIKYSLLFQRTK